MSTKWSEQGIEAFLHGPVIWFRKKVSDLLSPNEIKSSFNFEGTCQEDTVTSAVNNLMNARQKMAINKGIIQDSETNTLKRIAPAFPEITFELLSMHKGNFKLTSLEELQRITKVDSYPSIARHQACAVIVPAELKFQRQEDHTKAVAAILLAQVLLAEKQHESKEVNDTVKNKIATDSRFYVWKAHTCILFDGDSKVKLAKKHGIVCDDDVEGKVVLTEPWRKAGDAALKILSEQYELTKMLEPPQMPDSWWLRGWDGNDDDVVETFSEMLQIIDELKKEN